MKKCLCLSLVLLFLAGCTNLTPSPTAIEYLPVKPSATPFVVPDLDWDLRLVIQTTSDWTRLRLVSGIQVDQHAIASASPGALGVGFDKDGYFLSQALDKAEAGQSVEMTVELTYLGDPAGGDPLFEIDRGYVGATTLIIQRHLSGGLWEMARFTWDGIQSTGSNVQRFTLPLAQLTTMPKNEYIVIAQLNFWYYGPGLWGGFENDLGQPAMAVTPRLGKYVAADPKVVYQQIEWAAAYGVDAFSIEWTTPRGVGCCGSMEDTLDDVFLKSPNIDKVHFAIFYDFPLRLMQTAGLEKYARDFDFDQPEVFDTLVADFRNFAVKYFKHPQYLTIDGRPVVYIWASNAFQGDLAGAFAAARQAVADLGYDVYIVGDEIVAGDFNRPHVALFDGVTTFTFLIPGLSPKYWEDIGDAIPEVDRTFKQWRRNIANLKVAGRDELVNFQPAWAPQYDERYGQVGKSNPLYVPATSREQVKAMAEMVRSHAQSAGRQGLQLIWVNTWNCWGETTSIEPTIDREPKYPAGNYGFDFLEVVREVFGSETFIYEGP